MMNIWKIINEQISLILNLTLVGAALVVILVLWPMMHRYQELVAQEGFLVQDANLINGLIASKGHDHSHPPLIALKDAPLVMQEIIDFGNAHSITFLSMVNQDKSKLSYKNINTLPIDLEMRGTYQQLGSFIGGLNDLSRGIVLIDTFQIMTEPQEPDKIKARMRLYVCLQSLSPSHGAGKGASVSHQEVVSLMKDISSAGPFLKSMAWGQRNPFDEGPMGRQTVHKQQDKVKNKSVMRYDLSGIFWNEHKPSAIINDGVVNIGSSVGPSTVKEIRPGEVVLFDGKKDIVLMLRQN